MPGTPGKGAVYHWWEQPFANDFGGAEPYGNFPKPDLNIQVPQGMPVANVTPGTVTNVDTTSPWGYTVTIKLDNPPNALATHAAYLHMGAVNVSQGQHVGLYDQLGYAGPPNVAGFQNAPLGFAFYPGDKYGYGAEWNQYFQNGSDQRLNPYNWLRTFGGQTTNQTIVQPNAPNINAANMGGTGPTGCDTPVVGWFICQLPQFFARVGLFIVGLVFLIIGGIMLIHPEQPVGEVIKGAAKAGAA